MTGTVAAFDEVRPISTARSSPFWYCRYRAALCWRLRAVVVRTGTVTCHWPGFVQRRAPDGVATGPGWTR
jgi:hypothetical protein